MRPGNGVRGTLIGCAILILGTGVFASEIPADTAVLRWLDKVVARVSVIEAPVGQTFSIEGSTLRVIVRACVLRPPTETPENAAFLDVWEVKPGEPATDVFRGWMFASSPALSAMEHSVYDLWLLECHNNSETGTGTAAQKGRAW
ncbi:MAG: hypothetical protein FD149_111 [Rhodospirillaceae bacterium]|nr:MAG: hypothetical protein FD149_111 [Rhodospirillaceae bacterium]